MRYYKHGVIIFLLCISLILIRVEKTAGFRPQGHRKILQLLDVTSVAADNVELDHLSAF